MRIRAAILTLLCAAAPLLAQTTAPPPPTPPMPLTATVGPRFMVALVDVDSSALPALQSFSAAQGSSGKWLIAGGRTNGLHLFVQSSNGGTTAPPNAFPTTNANQNLWVIDPVAVKAWSAPLSSLPAPISDALSANNAVYYAADGNLYVIGGYGWSTATSQMTTFSTLTAINVDQTIAAIIAGTPFTSYVQQISTYYDCITAAQNALNNCPVNACPQTPPCPCTPGSTYQQCLQQGLQQCVAQQPAVISQCIKNVQAGKYSGIPTNSGAFTAVAGGGMEKLGNMYALAFGQNFQGLYSVNEGDYGKWPINQVYAEAVTMLMIQPKPLTAATLYQAVQNPNDPMRQYHRRDLNVVPGLAADGVTPIVQALGGVFVPGQDSAYRQPILISTPKPPPVPVPTLPINVTVDGYQQYMSQYECAVVPLFDRKAGALGNILLGGISLYYVDSKTGKLKADSGLPFISALSFLTRSATGAWSEYYRVAPITIGGVASRVGTDAKFMRNPAVAASPNGVIYIDTITTKTLVGWMYGGIMASTANPGSASGSGSTATGQLFQVWIDPTTPPPTYWASVTSAPQLIITPNSDTAKK
jgi:hypothetical protein